MNKKNIIYIICSVVFLIGIFALSAMMFSSEDNTQENNTDDEKKMANTVVRFKTNFGEFDVELFTEKSPITAGNFRDLVEDGFYDGTRFHRVIENFMIQGGDPQSKNETLKNRWGTGGPGYTIEDEFVHGLSNTVGTLSMANSGPSSGGSQFFINVADNTFLDFDKQPLQSKHPVFGKVISGMEVVMEISQTKTTGKGSIDRPTNEVLIESITIVN